MESWDDGRREEQMTHDNRATTTTVAKSTVAGLIADPAIYLSVAVV
jgi:hypothetical protein